MWIHREISSTLQRAAASRPVLLLTGARQTGKTSLLRKTFAGADYASLDLPIDADEAQGAGSEFLARHARPLIIDEVQYAPGLMRYLKHAVDERREEGCQYLLTGSQKFALMRGVSESLAGRIAVLECHPLAACELEPFWGRQLDAPRLVDLMIAGGYPEVHARDLDVTRFYSDYVATYLQRDVHQALEVRSLRDFQRFLQIAALRCGQLLSMNAIAVEIGVSLPTIKSWLSVLEASNIVVLLQPYFRNLGKRLIKTPKLYFCDTGLACFLAGFRSADDLRRSAMLGAIFENHVLVQLLRAYGNRGALPNVYFYRDQHGHEVDLVLPVGERLHLIEVKMAEDPPRSIKGFDHLARLMGADSVASRTVISTARGARHLKARGYHLRDSVDWDWVFEAAG